jgi:hypothetical protein
MISQVDPYQEIRRVGERSLSSLIASDIAHVLMLSSFHAFVLSFVLFLYHSPNNQVVGATDQRAVRVGAACQGQECARRPTVLELEADLKRTSIDRARPPSTIAAIESHYSSAAQEYSMTYIRAVSGITWQISDCFVCFSSSSSKIDDMSRVVPRLKT